MASYDVSLIGTTNGRRLEMPFETIEELLRALSNSRFVEGDYVDDDGVVRKVLLQTSRIQCIAEAE